MDKAGLVASCQSQETGPTPGGRPAVGVGAAAGPPQPGRLTVVVYQIGTLRQARRESRGLLSLCTYVMVSGSASLQTWVKVNCYYHRLYVSDREIRGNRSRCPVSFVNQMAQVNYVR